MKALTIALLIALGCAAETTPARVRFKVDPEYTKEARKAKLQGLVVLGLIVDTQGNPTQIRVLRSLGMGLDEKSVKAVRKWAFYPAMQDGQPVKYLAAIDVSFKLVKNGRSAQFGMQVSVTPVIRFRHAGLLTLLGAGVNGMWNSADSEWNSGRFYEQTPTAPPPAPYVRQYAEAPALSKVTVESNPPGATVSINFQGVGKTPLPATTEKSGTIYVLIRADGYDDYFHEYKVGPGEPVHVNALLERHHQ